MDVAKSVFSGSAKKKRGSTGPDRTSRRECTTVDICVAPDSVRDYQPRRREHDPLRKANRRAREFESNRMAPEHDSKRKARDQERRFYCQDCGLEIYGGMAQQNGGLGCQCRDPEENRARVDLQWVGPGARALVE